MDETQTAAAGPVNLSPRHLVGSLWLFVVLNYLYCDILGFYWADHVRAVLEGRIGNVDISQTFLLASAVLMSLPILGVLLSRIAPYGLVRWYSVGAALVMTRAQAASLLVGSALTLHYIYFSTIEITTTLFIAWYCLWRWRTGR